jgi:tRNA-specific 2-thiouridylase
VVLATQESDIFSTTLTADTLNFMGVESFPVGMEATAKIRYSHPGERCVVTACDGDTISLEFANPVRAVTPGQAVVLYDGDFVLGGGRITG